jgi:nitrogen fixation NifU-like protein
MSELQDLYQEMILDHYRRPRNCRRLEGCSCRADGHNPLCGDKITVYVDVEDGIVKDVAFEGAGCAISTASASIMTESVKGKTVEQSHDVFRRFHHLITGDATADESTDHSVDLGKLEVFSGVGQYPARVKCATLAWHTLEAALSDRDEAVTTE